MHPAYFEVHFIHESDWRDQPREFAIITAYAPTGEVWPVERNESADARLAEQIELHQIWHRRLTGYSPKTGHAEPGWAAEIALNDACDLGQLFEQDAIYFVRENDLFVTYCDRRRRLVHVGEFNERNHLRDTQLTRTKTVLGERHTRIYPTM